MFEGMRELLYPLGFVSSLAFSARFLLQWINSEIERKSVVSKGFWHISLLGNLMLLVHSLIQSQFHVCLIQCCNAVISWRNLNLMEPADKQVTFFTVIKMFVGAFLGLFLCFIAISFFEGEIEWFRLPNASAENPGAFWHVLGCIGLFLFSLRFWVQWWQAERNQRSELSLPFWWLSLVGAALSLVYFIQIHDPVNIVGPAVGLLPYSRNLMLMYRTKPKTVT